MYGLDTETGFCFVVRAINHLVVCEVVRFSRFDHTKLNDG